MSTAPLGPQVLAGLKDFQQATVEYVFQRMYRDAKPAHRFLVADEVGLGKTLVARGLIAKVIDELRESQVKRIDIVYVCSNADIGAQNIARLRVPGLDATPFPTRITLLPSERHRLKPEGVNLISITPGTSFDMGMRSGRQDERVLLFWLLYHLWGARVVDRDGTYRVFRGGAYLHNFKWNVQQSSMRTEGTAAGQLAPEMRDAFSTVIEERNRADGKEGRRTIRERFDWLVDSHHHSEQNQEWQERLALIGDLRDILATACVRELEPDLIILDEFQRFRHLLEIPAEGEEGARRLAHTLFEYESADGHARTLLLSATPYKMYTLSDESGIDDHYADFIKTTEFLMGQQGAAAFRAELRAYREALLDAGGLSEDDLTQRRRAVEDRLRQVMTRTERLAVTPDRAGMLNAPTKATATDALLPADVQAYLTMDGVSRQLRAQGDAVEYWKSAPYPLSFMEAYVVKKRLREALAADQAAMSGIAEELQRGDGLLDPKILKTYSHLDPGNVRLRTLTREFVDGGAWRLLWIPPSLPYYRLRGHFDQPGVRGLTKRLVFSSWTVAPKSIALVLSYAAERQMMLSRYRDPENTAEARKKINTAFNFRRVGEQAAAMTTFLLVSPSPALAQLGDPLSIVAGEAGGHGLPAAEATLRTASDRIRRALDPILSEHRNASGPADETWYWLAPLFLDGALASDVQAAFFARSDRELTRVWAGEPGPNDRDDMEGLISHIARAREALSGGKSLGRPPDDLIEVLALVAVAGPANCALRALARGVDRFEVRFLDAACRVAWGFRSLFGIPEVMALVRGRTGAESAYWKQVLGYCLDGCLQAVLDEYAHLLPEWQGNLDQTPAERAAAVAAGIYDSLTIRAPLYGYDAISVNDGRVELTPHKLRARLALWFGRDSTDEEAKIQRSSHVRTAFNSPFWPFVLATTSIGQEGLDFHLYCHAVVHWNLPANPVDLEQREGRVHRYKGHAVRRNVALAHGASALVHSDNPWSWVFDAAKNSRQASRCTDLVPYWIYEGEYRIERHVPVLPLSREIEKYDQLRRSLAAYRLVFGQPRQEDLVAYLSEHLPDEELARRMELLRIDLSPPSVSAITEGDVEHTSVRVGVADSAVFEPPGD